VTPAAQPALFSHSVDVDIAQTIPAAQSESVVQAASSHVLMTGGLHAGGGAHSSPFAHGGSAGHGAEPVTWHDIP
jgi:hypothetical protein